MTTSPADTAPGDTARPAADPEAGYDIAVLGAGPAGLSAAAAAAAHGARTVLIDAAPRPGGQYWRHRPADTDTTTRRDLGPLHHDWDRFRHLLARLDTAHGPDYRPGHAIWHVERTPAGFTVHATRDGAARAINARLVIVATGAYDRQLPFPGWTTPGVYTAGAVQALLKGHGVLAGRRIAVAGTGPFLLPVAAGLADAGARVVGVFEAGSPAALARHPLAALRTPARLPEAARYLRALAHHRIPYRTRTAVVGVRGTDTVTAARLADLDAQWRTVPGSLREVDCDSVAVGYGFTPQTEIPLQLGCTLRLDADGSLAVDVDTRQHATAAGVYAAGESCGVGGAHLAAVEGELAGLHAAYTLTGRAPERRRLARLLRSRAAHRAFAVALHQAYSVPDGWQSWLEADTVVCRCEEVGAQAIRAAVTDLGATDPRAAKLYARPGMGLCQGRVCGYAVAHLVAASCDRAATADDLRALAARPVAQPITLGTLAHDSGP
jgi:D-hydroxyproline dehydrogenase subunit alpha